MRQLAAFTKKEFSEQVRTGKMPVLMAVFCLFGIMNPAIAKLMPWLMEMASEQLAGSGMVIVGQEVDALVSWMQFFKNMPVALILFLVMFGGILTMEYQKGTLINMVTKGLERWKILAAKTILMNVLWTFGYWGSFGITYGYNDYFWDNGIAGNIGFSAFCFYLSGLWLVSVILPASLCFRSASAVILSVGASFLACYLLGLFPRLQAYLPTYLFGAAGLLAGEKDLGDYVPAVWAAVLLIIMNGAAAAAIFNKKNL